MRRLSPGNNLFKKGDKEDQGGNTLLGVIGKCFEQ